LTGPYYIIYSLAVFGSEVFAGTYEGVFLSTHNGATWSSVSTGLPNLSSAVAFAVSGNDIFAGISGGGVWRRPLSEMITSAGESKRNVSTSFTLSQNYPNPFNPSTTISFDLPTKSFVTLKVFDMIGREVATIVSKELSAGSYTRQWHAEGLPSGVYFYRLQAGSYLETKKLVLLR
jgi:hypothetical protein